MQKVSIILQPQLKNWIKAGGEVQELLTRMVDIHFMSSPTENPFFAVFMNRFRGGNGLYILDEPEAALSPTRQMSMISRIHQLVRKDSQFIIATHSPVLMAYPDAIIYEIKEGIKVVKYEETEHYQVMRSFLNNTQKMLNILMK